VVKACTTTGISEEETENSLMLYPNPAHNLLIIESGLFKEKPASVLVYDLAGKVHEISFKKQADQIILNISSLAGGSYTVRINLNDTILKRRFVKAD
jgi:hypothetical protein